MICKPVVLMVLVAWLASSALSAADVDTTVTKERVAPKRSFGNKLLQSPALLLKIPLKVVEGLTHLGVKLAYERKAPVVFIFKLFGTNKPLHPLISYGTKPSLEGGLGLRLRDVISPYDQIRAKALYSLNDYQYYHAGYEGPQALGPRTGFSLRGDYNWMPRESLFGVGNESRDEDEASVTIEKAAAETGISWAPRDHAGLVFAGGFRSFNVYDGEEEELVTDLDSIADTLGMSPAEFRSGRFVFARAELQHDLRDHRGQPLRGGTQVLSVEYHHGVGRSDDLTYWKGRVDLWQYFHLFRRRSLAIRLLVESVDLLNNKDDLGMPYYLLPTLGGEGDLRGYERNRFLGRGLALTTIEYRFPVSLNSDGFLFLDEGRVFDSMRDDFTFKNWRYSFGFGVRIWSEQGEKLRFTVAHSVEETRLYLDFGQML
jgi:outer membrane protein assembly factor BamA